MNPKQKYKNQIAAIKATLQKHDPLKYKVIYAGEKFEKQLYSYEATTIIEKFQKPSNNSEIETFIINCSKSNNEIDHKATKNVATEIGNIINGL